MAYTSHGRWIPGTSKIDGEVAGSIACPGIEDCTRCKSEIKSRQHQEYIIGSGEDYQEIAKKAVRDYIRQSQNQTYTTLPRPDFDVYVIWWSKTLQNWKAVLGTTLPDGKIYELTHNGNENTTYFDVYGKVHNFAITNPE